jgi:Ca2+-binding RTX toxin-like protein
MVTLQPVTTLFGGSLAVGARVTDFAVFATAQGTYLYAGAQPGMGMLSFSLQAGQAASFTGAAQYASGADLFGPTRLDLMTFGNTTVLLPSARFATEIAGPTLASTGSMGQSKTFSDGAGPGGDATDLEVFRIGADNFLYGVRPGGQGIDAWVLPSGKTALQQSTGFADDATTHLTGVTGLASLTVGAQRWLFAASAGEDGMTALSVASDGSLAHAGSVSAADGIGFSIPSAVEAVSVGGVTFAILAAQGSSSLTVFRVDPGGLVPTDHVSDSLDTRFQSVTAIDTLQADGRTWIFAGGADDGISVFQLLPDGRLILAATLADDATMPLADVAAIRAVQVGSEIQVFVASGSEDGVAQFRFLPGPPGITQTGGTGADTLVGGAGEDVILGGGGDDRLSGAGGDDILVDGTGADTLTGGAGADLFVLMLDGQRETITDFDPATDRLDLSDYPLLYDLSQVTVTPTATGATLAFAGEVIDIVSASGQPLSAADFTTAMILNMPRSPVEAILSARIPVGGAGADTIFGTLFDDRLDGGGGNDSLSGGWGDDRLTGGAGADTLDGGAGFDVALYDSAATGVIADLGQPARNAGDAAGDVFRSIEGLSGSAFGDDLAGDGADNWIAGNGGNDILAGGAGADTLAGGDGDDILSGGAGADSLDGGLGVDTADYRGALAGVTASLAAGGTGGEALGDTFTGIENLSGSDWDDRLTGDSGSNLIIGLAGADTLAGGAGDDTLLGGLGADRLDGGTGMDLASYADATAGVIVDMVNPANSTGLAAGDTFVGVEGLLGGDFDDDLRGDALANLIQGGNGNDWLLGRAGNDTLIGGAGNDNFFGGAGADLFDGGSGVDRAVYSDALAGIVVDFLNPARNTGDAAGDTFTLIEALRGSNFNDDLSLDNADNQVDAWWGNDTVAGLGGNDILNGRAGNDVLDGGDGNDQLYGGPGADRLIGGPGVDRAHYGDSVAAVVADLLDPTRNTGYAAGDTYSGIENLQGGTGNDVLGGDNAANQINGSKGNDRVEGRGGDDYLIGGDGNDTLWGGAANDLLLGGLGLDTFVFGVGDGADRVLDFAAGQDKLLFSSALAQIAGLSGAAIVAAYATDLGADVLFDFGGGDTLLVRGVADPGLIAGDIQLF